jgi:hypothetical protein
MDRRSFGAAVTLGSAAANAVAVRPSHTGFGDFTGDWMPSASFHAACA